MGRMLILRLVLMLMVMPMLMLMQRLQSVHHLWLMLAVCSAQGAT